MRFGVCHAVGRDDGIHHFAELGMCAMGVRHLRIVRAGYDGSFKALLSEFKHKLLCSSYVFKLHAGLVIEQFARYLILQPCRRAEIVGIYLLQGLTLDMVAEVGNLRMVCLSFLIPEEGILWLCIHNHAIEIEQDGQVCLVLHIYI